MSKIIICIISLLALELHAMEILVHYNNFKSTITSTPEVIIYKDVNTNLSLQKKKCNAHILERLSKELTEKSRNLLVEKVSTHPMTVIIDSNKNVIDQRSSRGQFFHHFIEVIKQAKIEEELNCR